MSANDRLVPPPVNPDSNGCYVPEGGVETQGERNWRRYGIGVDCHSRFITATVLVPDYAAGRLTRHKKNWPASVVGLKQAKAWISSILRPVAPDEADAFHYVLESSATYHLPVVHAWKGSPSIINPTLVKLGVRKTDDIDSANLADQDLRGYWPVTYLHPPELTALRVLWKERRRWQQKAQIARRSITSGLNRFGYSFQMLGGMSEGKVRALVEDFLLNQLQAPEATEHLSTIPIPDPLRLTWLSLLRQADDSEKWVRGMEEQVQLGLNDLEFRTQRGPLSGYALKKLLETVPGVGPVTASFWLVEVGDVYRFTSAKACVAWAGFDPSLKVSAGKVVAHVQRKGHRHLHHVIKEGASRVLQMDHPLGKWGKGIAAKHKKGGWHKAVGAIGRRMTLGMFYVHLLGEPYNPKGGH